MTEKEIVDQTRRAIAVNGMLSIFIAGVVMLLGVFSVSQIDMPTLLIPYGAVLTVGCATPGLVFPLLCTLNPLNNAPSHTLHLVGLACCVAVMALFTVPVGIGAFSPLFALMGSAISTAVWCGCLWVISRLEIAQLRKEAAAAA